MYVYIFLVNFHLWFSMLPRKHWPLEWELTAELCNTWSGTQSLMVIKGEQERNTKGFPWVGWVVFGWDGRGWKTATGNGPQDMQQPFIQEWEGGTGQGPMCPCGVCLKLDLQSQVILFKYIQEMKKNNPKTNKQKTKKKQTQESCGVFLFLQNSWTFFGVTGDYLVIIIKWVIITKRGTEKLACPVEDCSNRSKNAPGHAHLGMEDAAGHMAARSYSIKCIPGMEAQCPYSPSLAVPPGRGDKVSKI